MGTLWIPATFGAPLSAAQVLDDGEIDRRGNAVVVRVTAEIGENGEHAHRGTGFILNGENFVATNLHVVAPAAAARKPIGIKRGASSVKAAFLYYPTIEAVEKCHKAMNIAKRRQATQRSAAAVRKDEERIVQDCKPDLAILRVGKESFDDIGSVNLARSFPKQQNTDVRAYGFADISDRVSRMAHGEPADGPSVSEGALVAPSHGAPYLLEFRAATSPGYSGGPLFDHCGRVIGVNTLLATGASSGEASWAVWAGVLANLLDEKYIQYQKAEGTCAGAGRGPAEPKPIHLVGHQDADEDEGKDVTAIVAVALIGFIGIVFAIVLPGSVMWRVLATPAAIGVGIGVLALLFLKRNTVDSGSLRHVGEFVVESGDDQLVKSPKGWPDEPAGPSIAQPTAVLNLLEVVNQATQAIVRVRATPMEMEDWREIADAPIEAGGKSWLKLIQDYNSQCEFNLIISFEGGETLDLKRNVCIDYSPLVFYSMHRLLVKTDPPGGKVEILKVGNTYPMSSKMLKLGGEYVVKAKKDGYDDFETTYKHAVTYGQWETCTSCPQGRFVGRYGYKYARRWPFPWGMDRPAIKVNWDDAQKYVEWLEKKTKKQYRLLSASEYLRLMPSGSRRTAGAMIVRPDEGAMWNEWVRCGNHAVSSEDGIYCGEKQGGYRLPDVGFRVVRECPCP